MKLNICHLYGDRMNTYGDDGNITTIIKRCQWRGIEADVTLVSVGDKLSPKKFDFYFFGGGQDQQQITVSADLQKGNGEKLKEAVGEGAVVLAICGGYQLLGRYYIPHDGPKLLGIDLLDIYTIAGDRRMIGNIVVKLTNHLALSTKHSARLVGFENHSGQTFLGAKTQPLGTVEIGFGNNGQDKTEGAFLKNVFGCYLHGSLLPKNPHFADFLITKALESNYGKIELKPLNDQIEWDAHLSALTRARQIK